MAADQNGAGVAEPAQDPAQELFEIALDDLRCSERQRRRDQRREARRRGRAELAEQHLAGLLLFEPLGLRDEVRTQRDLAVTEAVARHERVAIEQMVELGPEPLGLARRRAVQRAFEPVGDLALDVLQVPRALRTRGAVRAPAEPLAATPPERQRRERRVEQPEGTGSAEEATELASREHRCAAGSIHATHARHHAASVHVPPGHDLS